VSWSCAPSHSHSAAAVEETVGAERAQGAAEEEAPAAAAVNVIKFVIAFGTKITVKLNRHDPAGNQ